MRAIFVDADGCLIDDGWADKQMTEEGLHRDFLL